MTEQKEKRMSENVTALTVARPEALSAYEPRDMHQALELAKMFAESRLVLNVATQAKAMLIMATGAELGIPATTALRAIHVINDRPAISAQLKLALCLRRKELCRYFKEIESTEERATYETWRIGDDTPTSQTFTIEDARRMRLKVDDPDSNWSKVRRRMLRWRAIGELADRKYPELMLGLPSTEELADDIIDMKPAPMQLDSALVNAATTTMQVAAAEKEQRQEERRADANAIEPLEDTFTRWQATLKAAVTTAECDRVGVEVKKRLHKDTPEYERGKEMVTAAKERLRTAHQRPAAPPPAGQQSLPSNPIDQPRDRIPGEDDGE